MRYTLTEIFIILKNTNSKKEIEKIEKLLEQDLNNNKIYTNFEQTAIKEFIKTSKNQ